MSLINEALKKAQRQRSLESAPLSAAPSGVAAAAVTTHVRAASHRRSLAPLWFGLGLVTLGVVATVLVMRYGFAPDAPEQPALASASPSLVSPTPASAPATAPALTLPSAPTSPVVMLPPIPQAAPSPAPAVSPVLAPMPSAPPLAPVPVAAPAPVAVAPVTAQPLSPSERESQVYAFLNTLRLTGVRGFDREARILMNERVWRLNDIVSTELGLRISAVRPNLLVFTDAQGRTYEKPY
jgi:hypothetical protein